LDPVNQTNIIELSTKLGNETTKDELNKLCKEFGLGTQGNKAANVERLARYAAGL
jgi:hypothetical protein